MYIFLAVSVSICEIFFRFSSTREASAGFLFVSFVFCMRGWLGWFGVCVSAVFKEIHDILNVI